MADWLFPSVGAGVLLLLAVDVFQTAFHAEGRGGPINRRQNRAIWRLIRWWGTRGGRTRDGVLSLGGPVMAIATMAVWTLLLLGGFALIYLPHIGSFHVSPGQPGPPLLEAFYYSGIIAATVGQGDVVAPTTTPRVLTILQALSGFALVTVAVTYVLAVYRELIITQALAASIDARLSHGRGAEPPDLAGDPGWIRSTTFQLAHALEAHFNFPILHYFRPGKPGRALPVQLSALLFALADENGDGPDRSSDSGAGATHPLRSMVGRYIGEVHSLFVAQEAEGEEDPALERIRLREILDMMAYPESPAEMKS